MQLTPTPSRTLSSFTDFDGPSLSSNGELWREIARSSTSRARELIPIAVAEKLCVLPLVFIGDEQRGSLLTALFPKPLSIADVQQLRFVAGCEVSPECIEREILEKAIYIAYRGSEEDVCALLETTNTELLLLPQKKEEEDTFINERSVPKLLSAILDCAISVGASDIHLEPLEAHYRVRFRVDGELRVESRFQIPFPIAQQICRRIKILSQLDITEQCMPQEGGFDHGSNAVKVRLRVSVLPQRGGEKICLRVLEEKLTDLIGEGAKGFSALGMFQEQERCVRYHVEGGIGTILCVGPTGSGKSTLLYAILHHLNTPWRNIVTIEDPVERKLPGVNQIDISSERGLHYQDFLPPVLRQDPDVLMIGEIRQKHAAQTALTAGITGQLVLSTIHAGSCLDAFLRLFNLGVDINLIFSSVRLLIGSRLIAKNCPECFLEEKIDAKLQRLFYLENSSRIGTSRGCAGCSFSGKRGRLAVFELFSIDERVREKLFHLSAVSGEGECRISPGFFVELKKIAFEAGFIPYAVYVREALQSGKISPEAALRSIGVSPDFVGY